MANCQILHLTNSQVPKESLTNFDFCLFFILKSDLPTFSYFFILTNIFWGGYAVWLCRHVPRIEGGIQVLAGVAPLSQTVGSLSRTPWPAKLARKYLTKMIF